jgi:hypothetical protein
MAGNSVTKRAALGGSFALLVIAAAVVLFDRSNGTTSHAPEPNLREQLIVYDADATGAIVTRGTVMLGITPGGRVRWRLPIRREDLLPFAVCLERCPNADVTMGRSGATPPDEPDGPRRSIVAPAWRPVQQRPRMRVDRPLLPGPGPARLIARDATGPIGVSLHGSAIDIRGSEFISALAASRSAAVLIGPRRGGDQHVSLLRRQAGRWHVRRRFALAQRADSTCLSADGNRMAIVGGGAPQVIDLTGGGTSPQQVPNTRALERQAGMCAVSGDRMATAITRSSSSAQETILTTHEQSGRRSTLRFTGPLPGGLWISSRTGAIALQQNGRVRVVSKSGRRSTWSRVQAAAPDGGSRLRLFSATGGSTVRSF